ncbi:MlaE family lipid ABC transporter permease subunit [Flaviflagellibacter deserti]|jgi:phospholipid/cholesterol/gamma-HCH transport system permease protein|uniref:MlaE family lipid ABC transporter permease subunit n=1 Tax=Flaviflagellibacter deserti TaxID=2267266 RepID=A0ABV9YZ04_9HYPH
MSAATLASPRLEPAAGGLAASGAWTSSHATEIYRLTDEAARQPAKSLTIDIAGVGELDTFGAWLLERLLRKTTAEGGEARLAGVPGRFNDLIEEVRQSNRAAPAPERKETWVASQLIALGQATALTISDGAKLLALFGAIAASVGRAIVRPSTFRFTSLVHHLDRVAWQSVPIIVLITFLIGCIIAQQGFFHFRQFGAEDYVVDLVGVLVLREIGVLLVAIMIAGRSGSSYTAELGSMKMREEIDALRTMGRDPVEVLILPRIVAIVLAMPILTFLGGMSALVGGGVVAWLYAGMSPEIYIGRLHEAITLTTFQVGMIKAPFMALLIGTVACNEGLKVKGSAESLGLGTTASVVKSIFLVIVLDGFFAIFFSSIGM